MRSYEFITEEDDVEQQPKQIGDTILVDGKHRHTTNNQGNPIANTPEALTNFWKWFGDSIVVDGQGRPKVMYHGTAHIFDIFDTSKIGLSTGTSQGYGFYFTDDKNTAMGYKPAGKGALMETYLRVLKPLHIGNRKLPKGLIYKIIVEMVKSEIYKYRDEIKDYRDSFISNYVDTYSVSFDSAVKQVADIVSDNDTAIDQISELANSSGSKEAMFDAVRTVTNFDAVMSHGYSNSGEGGDIYVVWHPNQVKSVTSNTGSYSSDEHSIIKETPLPPELDKSMSVVIDVGSTDDVHTQHYKRDR